jgi:beta-lactamase class A
MKMTKLLLLITLLFLITPGNTSAQTTEILRKQILEIISGKNAEVSLAIIGNKGMDTLSIRGKKHCPMQSVFKFHIALALLSEIDKGKFTLGQKVKIEKNELLPGLYSPLREKFPNGAVLSIGEILDYMVCDSDNVACDVLLKLLGGPQIVESYFVKNNFSDLSIKINEETMQKNWDLQYQNWTTPISASEVLMAFYKNRNNLLSAKSYDLIWKLMKGSRTSKKRIRGELPERTVVANKTGYSGTNKQGVTAAVNDIGIVFISPDQYFYISVFVSDSREDLATNEKIIADITKAAWEYFKAKAD